MKKGIILFICIVQSVLCAAQSFYCKSIGLAEGLSQSGVTSVIYDNYGSLWVGTRYGLNEYRAGGIKVYVEGGDNHLDGSYVNFLFLDQNGSLWVSTDSGLSVYDESSGSFTLKSKHVVYSALDIPQEGKTLFGSASGMLEYSHVTKMFSLGGKPNTYIVGLYSYNSKVLVVDRGLGLFYYSPWESVEIPGFKDKVIMDSVLDGDELYLAVFREGIYRINLKTNAVKRFSTSNSALTYDVVLTLLHDGDKIWMGTDGGGVCILDKEKQRIYPFEQYFNHHTGNLPDKSVSKLYKDPHGNYWVGSVRNALYGFKPSNVNLLVPNVINAICISEDKIWTGTDDMGIACINQSSSAINYLASDKDDKISSICDYDSSRLLVSIYSKGFHLVNKRTGRKTPVVIVDRQTNAVECFTGNSPSAIKLQDGRFLMLAVNVYEYLPGIGRFLPYSREENVPLQQLSCIGRSGSTVYAMCSNGLMEIDTQSRKIRRLLQWDGINAASYNGNEIWFGSNSGLCRYFLDSGQVQNVETSLFKRVTSICHDSKGIMWLAADNTLFHYEDGRFELFGENEGFAPNEVLCSLASESGQAVYFGGTNGLVQIKDYSRPDSNTAKSVKLHNLSYLDRSSISLAVTINGSDPFEKLIYRYIVEGNEPYVIESYEDHIQLHSMKAGKYSVKVSFLQNDGRWSKSETVASFKIRNPWYRSTAFMLFLILLFLALTILLFVRIYNLKVESLEADLRQRNYVFTTKLDAYIESNLSDPSLDVSAIATEFAMSRAALYNKVKSALGKPVAEYIMEKRMQKARELLKVSSLSVTEISEKVGFTSPKYFSTRFRVLNNCSPMAYRRMSRED